jgi:hypothetical protein
MKSRVLTPALLCCMAAVVLLAGACQGGNQQQQDVPLDTAVVGDSISWQPVNPDSILFLAEQFLEIPADTLRQWIDSRLDPQSELLMVEAALYWRLVCKTSERECPEACDSLYPEDPPFDRVACIQACMPKYLLCLCGGSRACAPCDYDAVRCLDTCVGTGAEQCALDCQAALAECRRP